jgi:hypothetical protein
MLGHQASFRLRSRMGLTVLNSYTRIVSGRTAGYDLGQETVELWKGAYHEDQ